MFIEENVMSRCLVQPPRFYLTLITDIAMVLAGYIMPGLGNTQYWLPIKDQVSYVGIVPRTKQTVVRIHSRRMGTFLSTVTTY